MSGKCPTRRGPFERQDGAMLNNFAFFLRWRRVVPMSVERCATCFNES